MNERRCVCGLPWTDEHRAETKLHWEEPQEGTPGESTLKNTVEHLGSAPAGPVAPAGVPSCDSPELAAIRARSTRPGCWPASSDDMRTLLRMVDKLTNERDGVQLQADAKIDQLLRERDDLRAKLSDAARIHVESEVNHAYRVKELEAKLASATQQLCEEARAHGETQAKLALSERACASLSASLERTVAKCDEVEAKLAEAEKDLAAVRTIAHATLKRAEAAEARVRTLTSALFAATGGHVDLDKLEGR